MCLAVRCRKSATSWISACPRSRRRCIADARGLRELADEPDDVPRPELSKAERDRLGAYVAHFNARDFDAIRAMITDDVRLDLVNKARVDRQGRSVPVFRKLFQAHRLASGAGIGRGPSGHPRVRSQRGRAPRRNISCCCNGRLTRSPTSAISVTRITSSTAPNIACDFVDSKKCASRLSAPAPRRKRARQ